MVYGVVIQGKDGLRVADVTMDKGVATAFVNGFNRLAEGEWAEVYPVSEAIFMASAESRSA